ncbi:MAG TPA: hypothetical protein VEJ63_10965 [Planctomycetota bacterium]|nr:hypothetical protein [Planctomycetota bacterium]
MAMKETAGSMGAYFILVAVLSFLLSALPLLGANLPPLFFGLAIIQILFCIAYLVAGIRVRHFLERAPNVIRGIILGNAAYVVILFGIFSSFLTPEQQGRETMRLVISLLISWYLWSNTNRLSKEMREAAAAPQETSETQSKS